MSAVISTSFAPERTGGGADVQARRPRIALTLSRVGVTGVEKIVRVVSGTEARENLFYAQLDCFVDLAAAQKGVHMSRFEEVVNEAIDEVVLGEAFRAEILAGHIAERIRERQSGARAEVSLRARYPELKTAPASGMATQEIYTMFGVAVASEAGTRRVVGVQAQGMTACPCAQEMVADRARDRLLADGFDDEQIARVFAALPTATHNQRGIATLYLGSDEHRDGVIRAERLLALAENAMSSEIYELMKRSDEVEVVERAHRRPRFVEDCVREMVAGAAREYARPLGEGAFVFARQENLETIHQHNVVAERHGLLTELATELDGGATARHLTMREWLDSPPDRHDG